MSSVARRAAWRIAVIADTHIEPHAAGAAEPRSNRRSRAAVAAIRELGPDIVVHLGDFVHPLPAHASQDSAWDAAAAIMEPIGGMLLATPGNHDIGDKPSPTMPAAAARAAWQARFVSRIGPLWQAHALGPLLLLFVAAPILGSGSTEEEAQFRWLETMLADARAEGRRVLLFTHYPPFLLDAGEPGHYDNLDPAPRARLLALAARFGIEAILSGHVHGFFHARHAGTDCYVVPSAAFARRDYAELALLAPAPAQEFGRNEKSRLGFALLDIDAEGGHAYRPVQTEGAEAPPAAPIVLAPHPASGARALLGVPLLHPWAENVPLAVNPPTAPFRRRRVPDCRTMLLLLQLGLGRLRIPIEDLTDPAPRARISAMAAQGFRFRLSSTGVPDAGLLELAAAAPLAGWELALAEDEIDRAAQAITPHVGSLPAARILAPRVSTAARADTAPAKLFVGAGFAPDAAEARRAALASPCRRAAFTATMTRIPAGSDAFEAMRALDSEREVAAVTVCLAGSGPDSVERDDGRIAARVAETCFAAWCFPRLDAWLDTLLDFDRGYYVRNGLADRAGAPRAAGLVVRHLHAVLAGLGPVSAAPVIEDGQRGRRISVLAGSSRVTLRLARSDSAGRPDDPAQEQWADLGVDLAGGSATGGAGPSLKIEPIGA